MKLPRMLVLAAALPLALALPGASLAGVPRASHAPAERSTSTAAALPAGALAQVGRIFATHAAAYGDYPVNGPSDWASADDLATFVDQAGHVGVATRNADNATLRVDSYAANTYTLIGTHTISLAGWPTWGGLYAAPDGSFYILLGRANPAQDDQLDVLAVRRYDQSWNLVGTAYVQGGASQAFKGIWKPWSDASMLLVGKVLVVHTARQMYAIDGVHHQSNLTFEVDTGTMTTRTFESVGDTPYASHSFNQFAVTAGSTLVLVDHGDAYPRGIQVTTFPGYTTGSHSLGGTYVPFEFMGELGDNYTGATVTGAAGGTSRALVVGTSVPHHNAVDGVTGDGPLLARNAYVISQSTTTSDKSFRWLTTFDPHGHVQATEPRLVKIGDDRFVVLFTVLDGTSTTMEYRLLDQTGAVLAKREWPGGWFGAASQPIVTGKKILWSDVRVLGGSVPAYLYGLDLTDPVAPRRLGAIPSPDATLHSLRLTSARLKPAFGPKVTRYRGYVPRHFASAVVYVRLTAYPWAKVTFRVQKGKWRAGHTVRVRIAKDQVRTVRIHVGVEDHSHRRTYTVTLRRAPLTVARVTRVGRVGGCRCGRRGSGCRGGRATGRCRGRVG